MSVGTPDSSKQLSKTITQMTIGSNLLTRGARQGGLEKKHIPTSIAGLP